MEVTLRMLRLTALLAFVALVAGKLTCTLVLGHLPVTFTVIKYQGILLCLILYFISQLKQSTISRLLRNNLRINNVSKSTNNNDKLYIFMSSIK